MVPADVATYNRMGLAGIIGSFPVADILAEDFILMAIIKKRRWESFSGLFFKSPVSQDILAPKKVIRIGSTECCASSVEFLTTELIPLNLQGIP